jgi:hypothetical protein
MASKKQPTKQVKKSAADGRFVSEKKVQNSPNTTYKQTVRIPKPKSK